MEHAFRAAEGRTPFSIGIEEELMIVDPDGYGLVNAIERLLGEAPVGEVKPELMESVLEIATEPCATTTDAAAQLRTLRSHVASVAGEHGLTIGSAGTHPFALWEDQRIAARDRYRDLVRELRFVARQELLFGLHVHVGIDDPDVAIHVVDGMRVHLPILLALSANSPFWRGDRTGLMSSRTPVFRAFPRIGVPQAYGSWDRYEQDVEFLMRSGVMSDPTYVWHDVRPQPKLGTVEVRVCDGQTRVEHTVALAALIQAMVHELAAHYEADAQLGDYPWQILDENKYLAAIHGMEGELVDLPSSDRVATKELAQRLLDRLREHAQELGSEDALEGISDILARGTGADRQILVHDTNHDLREVMQEIVATTVGR
ncbi:carboxylate-amine ligase [Patulibacter brassicae]|jgi:carboxylate-amine ligase|uniref:Putative glutamate--cysteine ligase 2 n=1 Tax=Patulibacter brassicae TaxID=1705717 RepID=A0ABU4VNK1_9ACTN|nr:carboxylate-amine ligase [Patulibacter brassicae]MDX8153433.1 carboxylate-amine ligase [Patulibacter brassicae]